MYWAGRAVQGFIICIGQDVQFKASSNVVGRTSNSRFHNMYWAGRAIQGLF